jgi:hypothetical protein
VFTALPNSTKIFLPVGSAMAEPSVPDSLALIGCMTMKPVRSCTQK